MRRAVASCRSCWREFTLLLEAQPHMSAEMPFPQSGLFCLSRDEGMAIQSCICEDNMKKLAVILVATVVASAVYLGTPETVDASHPYLGCGCGYGGAGQYSAFRTNWGGRSL